MPQKTWPYFLVVGGALKARELHLFPKDRETCVDAVDVMLVHEKSWSSIFLGSLGT